MIYITKDKGMKNNRAEMNSLYSGCGASFISYAFYFYFFGFNSTDENVEATMEV